MFKDFGVGVQVVALEVPSLGNRCHLVHDGTHALVVDPPRDLALVEAALERAEVELTAVADTHVHNDFVSGSPVLAARHRVDHLVSAHERIGPPHRGMVDQDRLELGGLRITALDTPGHTPHHQSFLVGLADRPGGEVLLSGGSMLLGSVGRTDLLGPERALDLARAQWDSLHRQAALPEPTLVLPTHGFGSFCSAGATTDDPDHTVGRQRRVQPGLRLERERFARELVAGFGPIPGHFAHMDAANRSGPTPVPAPRFVGRDEALALAGAGAAVIDVRPRRAWAASHLPDSLGIEYGAQAATYAGWVVPYETTRVVVGDDVETLLAMARDLARIGLDDVHLALSDEWTSGAGTPVVTWDDWAAAATARVLLDVRLAPEHAAARIDGALHIPLHELADRLADVPPGTVWVHCQAGYRATIAAGILEAGGRRVVLVDDCWDNARHLATHRAA